MRSEQDLYTLTLLETRRASWRAIKDRSGPLAVRKLGPALLATSAAKIFVESLAR
jgi:hypothetical protein